MVYEPGGRGRPDLDLCRAGEPVHEGIPFRRRRDAYNGTVCGDVADARSDPRAHDAAAHAEETWASISPVPPRFLYQSRRRGLGRNRRRGRRARADAAPDARAVVEPGHPTAVPVPKPTAVPARFYAAADARAHAGAHARPSPEPSPKPTPRPTPSPTPEAPDYVTIPDGVILGGVEVEVSDPGELKLIMTKAEDGFDKPCARSYDGRAWEATAAGPCEVTCCLSGVSTMAACQNAQVVDNAAKCWITSGMEGQDGSLLQLHHGRGRF